MELSGQYTAWWFGMGNPQCIPLDGLQVHVITTNQIQPAHPCGNLHPSTSPLLFFPVQNSAVAMAHRHRWCIYRPAGDDESARTAENLHLDVNPWTYAARKPTEIESLRRHLCHFQMGGVKMCGNMCKFVVFNFCKFVSLMKKHCF